jgi:hypothetical protein
MFTADAGADLDSWRSQDTDYDLVQTAANMGDLEASLKLVEAGCKWQLPKGQRMIDGSIFYAPDILKCYIPNLKVSYSCSNGLGRAEPSNPQWSQRLMGLRTWATGAVPQWLLAYNKPCTCMLNHHMGSLWSGAGAVVVQGLCYGTTQGLCDSLQKDCLCLCLQQGMAGKAGRLVRPEHSPVMSVPALCCAVLCCAARSRRGSVQNCGEARQAQARGDCNRPAALASAQHYHRVQGGDTQVPRISRSDPRAAAQQADTTVARTCATRQRPLEAAGGCAGPSYGTA